MGFGTQQQAGNRPRSQGSGFTNLGDLFGNNIGAPQPGGNLEQPNQLFNILQALLQNNTGQSQSGNTQQTPMSQLTAQPPKQSVNAMPLASMDRITNPFGPLINQRFLR